MTIDKATFDQMAEGLEFFNGLDWKAKVIAVEPIRAEYFRQPNTRQRCIVERADGKRYISNWD